jgi:hypothetical protein
MDFDRGSLQLVFGRVNALWRHWFAEVIGEGRIFPTLREALDAVRLEGAPILFARDYCCGKRELF